jgi:putative copper export protein
MIALAGLGTAAADANDLLPLLVGAARLAGYLGFVLVVGTTFFLAWLWPAQLVGWVFIRLFYGGAALLLLGTAAVQLLGASGSVGDAFAGTTGAAALARLSVLALGLAFAWEMLGSARRWRVLITVWQLALVETFVVGSDAWSEPWRFVKVLTTTGHLMATAAWLGGLLALAVILLPSQHFRLLHDVLPRFSVLAIVSVVTLTVTGALHALVVAGSVAALIASPYGAVLAIKVVMFAVMLLLGNVGRRYAGHLARRKVTQLDESAPNQSISAFAVAVGAEFALATAVLAATAALVHVAPSG